MLSIKVGIVCLCALVVVPASSWAWGQFYRPNMPRVPSMSCSGFPGSPEWYSCFNRFQRGMSQYQQQMQQYAQQMQYQAQAQAQQMAQQNGYDGQSGTSVVASDGFVVKASNIGVSSMSINGRATVNLEGVAPDATPTQDGNKLTWKGTNPNNGQEAWFEVELRRANPDVSYENSGNTLVLRIN